jgi:hypothetical protein
MDIAVRDGIIIGAVGGAVAGLAVWLINLGVEKINECCHKTRIYGWLYKVTKGEEKKWRSTRTIASYNNLTEDRVRYICSIHEKIILSTGKNEDMWGIKEFTRERSS